MADIINGETIAGTITEAEKLTNIDRQTVYNRRNQDKNFTKDMTVALDTRTQILENDAYKRAMVKLDLLLMFLLKARDPKYRDKQEINHDGNTTFNDQIINARPRINLNNDDPLKPCSNLNIEHQPNNEN